MTLRRLVLAAVGAIVVATVAVAVPHLVSGSGPSPSADHVALTTATVRRTDLTATTPVKGVVSFQSPNGELTALSIVQPGGTAPSALGQHQQSAAASQLTLSADRQAAADASASDTQAVAQAEHARSTAEAVRAASAATLQGDQSTLAADQQRQASDCQGADGTASDACAADEARVAADQRAITADQQQLAAADGAVDAAQGQLDAAHVKATQSADQAQAKVAADELALSNASSAVAGAQASQSSFDATSRYTALPAVGQIVQPGTALWAVDGNATALLPGTLTPWRAFYLGMAPGPDVAVLDQALIAVGHGGGLHVSNDFTGATAAAIGRLQAALGEPRTGALSLGSVIFEPSAVRIATVHVPVGATVAAGAPVVDVTATTPVVDVALPVDQSYLVKVGDHVSVTLPDETTRPGTISAVGTVATTTTPTQGSSSGSSSSPPAATISVTVSLSQTGGAASLDQAPVTVAITSDSVADVLAVPTTALVALAGGGYAVEVVDANGVHRLLAVTTGLFDDAAGLVQVSGAGLAAGQTVVAPA